MWVITCHFAHGGSIVVGTAANRDIAKKSVLLSYDERYVKQINDFDIRGCTVIFVATAPKIGEKEGTFVARIVIEYVNVLEKPDHL